MGVPRWFDATRAEHKGREHWLEQASLAEQYARSRPTSDIDGFIDSLRDAEAFRQLAALADRPTSGDTHGN